MFAWLFGEEPEVTFISPLTPDECRRRLKEAVDTPWTLFGKKPAIGGPSGDGFELRKRISYRNSFQARLLLELAPQGRGARLRCRIGMHPLAKGFMLVWLGIVTSFALIFPAEVLRGPDAGPQLLFAFAPLGMLAFGIGLVVLGRKIASGEHDFLRDFVKTTLDAQAR